MTRLILIAGLVLSAHTAFAQNTGRPTGTTCITQVGWCPISPPTAPGTGCSCNTASGFFLGTAS